MKAIGEFLLKHLFGNVSAKIMALVMAVALWMFAYIFSYATDTEPQSVPVVVKTPPGWSVAAGGETTTGVLLVYPRRLAENVALEVRAGRVRVECEAPADPANPADNQRVRVRLKEANLVASRELGIKSVTFVPSELQLQIVREISRPLPVIVNASPPPPGYEIAYRPYVSPSRVEVRGQKDIVSRANGIETTEIYISDPPPDNAPQWTVQPPRVRLLRHVTVGGQNYPVAVEQDVVVRVDLRMLRTERTFTALPIRLLGRQESPFVIAVREQSSDVRVRGPSNIVESLKPENIVLYVDLTKLTPAAVNYTQPVEARIVNVPRPDDLVVTPAVATCAVRVSEPPAAKAP
jgi:hypothetical protein